MQQFLPQDVWNVADAIQVYYSINIELFGMSLYNNLHIIPLLKHEILYA